MGGEDHAGSADAALGAAFFEETLLDGMEFFVSRQAFDGGDLRAFGLQGGDEAGVDEVAVDEDGAGSAVAFAAAFLGAGEWRSSRRTSRRRFIGGALMVCFWPLMVNWMGVIILFPNG